MVADRVPRAFVEHKPASVSKGRRRLLAVSMTFEAGLLGFIIYPVFFGYAPDILQAILLAIVGEGSRVLNDKIHRPTPVRIPGALAVRIYEGAFRPFLTVCSAVGCIGLVYFQFGAVLTATAVAALGLGSLLLKRQLRRHLGSSVRLRDVMLLQEVLRPMVESEAAAMRGDLAAAHELAEQVARHPEVMRFPKVIHSISVQRSDWAQLQGDFVGAESELLAAVDYLGKTKDVSAAAESLAALGKFYMNRGRFEEARLRMDEAVAVGGGKMYRPNRAQIEFNRAVIAVETDDNPRAAEHARQAAEMARRWRLPNISVTLWTSWPQSRPKTTGRGRRTIISPQPRPLTVRHLPGPIPGCATTSSAPSFSSAGATISRRSLTTSK
jgi:hypothetical protein